MTDDPRPWPALVLIGDDEAGLCADGVCAVPEAEVAGRPETDPRDAPA